MNNILDEVSTIINEAKSKLDAYVRQELALVETKQQELSDQIKIIKSNELKAAELSKTENELILRESLLQKREEANRERAQQLDIIKKEIDTEKERISRILA